MLRRILWTIACSGAALCHAANDPGLGPDQLAGLADYFGFGPMQIYKADEGIQLLELADLNGDSHTDIAFWNGHKSRFELFYQRDPNAIAPAPTAAVSTEPNEIPDRGKLRRENVAVAYRVASMKIADLTGDQRPDITFFGEPRELVILPGRPEGGFGPPDALRAPEGEPRGSFLGVGDFNSDGRADVALLGLEVLQIYLQKPGGGLAKPERFVHRLRQPGLMLAADVNGDGRDDLAIGVDDDEYGLAVFLQEPGGTFSALRRVKMPRLRSITFAKTQTGAELFSVEAATGHLKQYRWEVREEAAGVPDWPQHIYSYPLRIEGKRMPFAVGDLTGDGLVDCVTADPNGAQIIVFAGTPTGLAAGKPFPGLMKATDLQIADLNADGRAELLSVSPEEKSLGLSNFEQGRVSFPRPMALAGVPLAAAVGSLSSGGPADVLACVLRDPPAGSAAAKAEEEEDEEEAGGGRVRIRLLAAADGRELQNWATEELEDDPAGLRFADVNQDGRNDLLLFVRYHSPQTYLQQDSGRFAPLNGGDIRASLIRNASLETFSLADVTGDDKPEVLIAQRGVARALVVQEGRWTVVDQYNPGSPAAQITGLAALPGAPGSPMLTLYDRNERERAILQRGPDNPSSVAQTMPLGDFDVSAIQPLPLGAGRTGLILADANRLALLLPGAVEPTMVEQHSYESEMKDAWLADAVVGDINHDGVRDVVVIDMRKAGLENLTTLSDGSFVRAARFQVFQGKRFSDDPSQMGEPRETLLGDVTGDGCADVVLLVHDRLIVYPSQ